MQNEMEVLRFFEGRPFALQIYETFEYQLLARLPDTKIDVQKSQITLRNPRVFGCVSLMRVRRPMPPVYMVVTFGLSRRLASPRIDTAVEPYPNRWTHHAVLTRPEEVDDELMEWMREAYDFAWLKKGVHR